MILSGFANTQRHKEQEFEKLLQFSNASNFSCSRYNYYRC